MAGARAVDPSRIVGVQSLRETPVADPAVPRLELAEWADRYGVVAGITSRGSGFSLGLWSAEPVGQVMTRWRAFRTALPSFPGCVLGHQIHGVEVRWHDAVEGWVQVEGIDGHAANTPGQLLAVTVADCIPIYLVAPGQRAIALLHSGWRGTAGRILERGVAVLGEHCGVHPTEIVMHCGVGICGECYEVGSEVAERLSDGESTLPSHIDLRLVLARQAEKLGIGTVTISPWCTAHHHDRFFSHRASAGGDGRQVAYLGIPSA